MDKPDFSHLKFGPVIDLPEVYDVYDFTVGYDPDRPRLEYGIGRYNELRPGMYSTSQFQGSGESETLRNIHIGIDIAAPVGAPVRAFADGDIFMAGINDLDGDYGGTVITKHSVDGRDLYALHGHLSHQSANEAVVGSAFKRGDKIASIGPREENGGWNPHLHFQLSWLEPLRCDMPGTTSLRDREQALIDFPDPRIVLGPLY